MKQHIGALVVVALVAGWGGPAVADAIRPVFHEETGRIVDEMSEHLRGLGARVERHLYGGSGPGGMGPGVAALPAERPLITIMLHHRSELGLTGEQVSRLEGLRSDFARQAIRSEAEIRIAEFDLATLLGQEPVDMAKVEAKIREAAQLRADLRVARLRTIEQGRAVLTPDQKARLQGILGGGVHGPRRSAEGGTRL